MWVKNRHSGFTIVELLIVIVVIAVLAVITIVAFNGVQQRSRVSAVNAALSQAKKKLEVYKIDNSAYPSTNNLADAGISSGSTSYEYTSTGTTYCLTATNGNVSYKMTETSSASTGGCAGHAQGGVAAITNMAINPAATGYTTTQSQFGWRSDRYTPSGTYSIVSNASDGPTPQLTTYARFTFTQAVGNGRGFHNVGNPEGAVPSGNGAPVIAGQSYTLSTYFRSSDGQGTASIAIRYVDASDAWLGATIVGTSPSLSGNQWVRSSLTTVAPVGAVKAHVYIRQNGTVPNHTIGDTLDGTGLMVVQSSSLNAYADGNSPDWVWNGTANNATSTGPPQ